MIRFALAMGVAALADTIGIPGGEFVAIGFDLLIAVALSLCLGGIRPEIVVAFLLEAIPGVGLFPSWALAVPALWARLRYGAGRTPAGPPLPGR